MIHSSTILNASEKATVGSSSYSYRVSENLRYVALSPGKVTTTNPVIAAGLRQKDLARGSSPTDGGPCVAIVFGRAIAANSGSREEYRAPFFVPHPVAPPLELRLGRVS